MTLKAVEKATAISRFPAFRIKFQSIQLFSSACATLVPFVCWLLWQSWITHCACSYVTREALLLGSRMNSTRLDSITFKAFFRKTSQSTLCLLRFSAGQDMLTQEDKCLNWNSRLVEEVEVDCTRSLVCGVMWKFLVYRRFKTPSTHWSTWEKLLISLFGSRFG